LDSIRKTQPQAAFTCNEKQIAVIKFNLCKSLTLPWGWATLAATSILCGLAVSVQATTIFYDLTLGGGGGTFNYTVENDTLGPPITDFIIYFPDISYPGSEPQFPGLAITTTVVPAGWSPTVYPLSLPNLDPAVEFSTPGGVPTGGSLGGFSISFTYSGSGVPGSQYFEVDDPNFALIDSGYTVANAMAVPEQSASITCTLLGLLGLAGFRLRYGLRRSTLRESRGQATEPCAW
jgi:hypothetical protein